MKKARSDSFWKCQGCSFCSQQDCFWLSLVLLPTLEKGCFQAKCPPYVCLYVQNVHPALEYAYKLCWKLHSWDFHAIFDFCISKKGAATPFPTYPLYSVGWELSWEHMQRWLTPQFHSGTHYSLWTCRVGLQDGVTCRTSELFIPPFVFPGLCPASLAYLSR